MRRATLEGWIVRPALVGLGLIPAAGLVLGAIAGDLGANPIETITRETGQWTLRLLLVTLAITPLRRLSGWSLPVRMRRAVGLLAYFYASMHLATYVGLDQFFAWRDIADDIVERPYITVGFFGFLLLTPLALTSTNGWIKRLGAARWKRLHRLAYFAGAAGVLHFTWLVKADLREPAIYAGVLAALMLARARWRRRAAPLGASAAGIGGRG